jgi:prevent-host-death family protein
MRSIPISEFKAKCLSLVEEVHRTGKPIEVTKRAKPVVIVNPPAKGAVDWTLGAFRYETRILGDIECDLADLGVEWEVMR